MNHIRSLLAGSMAALAVLLLLISGCTKDSSPTGLNGGGSTINISGVYVNLEVLINSLCDSSRVGSRYVFLSRFLHSGDTVKILHTQTQEVLFSGMMTGSNFTVTRIDTVAAGDCEIIFTVTVSGSVQADSTLQGSVTVAFDTNEDPGCFIADCTEQSSFTAEPFIPPAADVSGTWSGTVSGGPTPTTISLNLSQTNENVGGTYSTALGGEGDVDAIMSGSTVYFVLSQTTPGCEGYFMGKGTVSGNTISFTATGSDCQGTSTVMGSVTKQ